MNAPPVSNLLRKLPAASCCRACGAANIARHASGYSCRECGRRAIYIPKVEHAGNYRAPKGTAQRLRMFAGVLDVR